MIKEEYKKSITMYIDTLEITVKKVIEKGMMPPSLDPRAAAWIFIGIYNTFLSMIEFKFKEFDIEFVRKVIDIMTTMHSDKRLSKTPIAGPGR